MNGTRQMVVGFFLVFGTLAAAVGFNATAPTYSARPSVVHLVNVPASEVSR